MKKSYLLLTALLVQVAVATVAKPVAGQAVASNTVATNSSVGHATTSQFSLPQGTVLTPEVLDKCWANRHNKVNQKIIADYLLTEPKLSVNSYELAWRTAQLVSFIGNFGIGEKRFVDTKEGVKLFNYGAELGKIAYKLEPKKVEGYYWFAINLGSYGLAKGILSAAAHAGEGMDALKKAHAIDPSYQWYGSSRILARYYQELPGIFGGSNKKALSMFEEATTKAPEFDNNWLFLGRFYLYTKDYQEALAACTKAVELPALDGRSEEMRYKREAKECVNKAQSKIKKT
jgi:tetratricopeptide (TPR) repeat protein